MQEINKIAIQIIKVSSHEVFYKMASASGDHEFVGIGYISGLKGISKEEYKNLSLCKEG